MMGVFSPPDSLNDPRVLAWVNLFDFPLKQTESFQNSPHDTAEGGDQRLWGQETTQGYSHIATVSKAYTAWQEI